MKEWIGGENSKANRSEYNIYETFQIKEIFLLFSGDRQETREYELLV